MSNEITQADRELLKSCMDNPPARIYSELVPAVVALRAIAAARLQAQVPSGGRAVAVVGPGGYPNWLLSWLESPAYRALPQGTHLYTARPSAPEPQVVPGVMACAKCKFQVVRTNLYLRNGTTGPGGNETEPCPNGCGPLWPVTWEQEARECWARFEELAEDVADARRFHWIEANAKVHAFSHGWVHWPQNPDRRPLAERIDEVIAKAATDESRG